METITFNYGGLSESQHAVEDLQLEVLRDKGAIMKCREALMAASERRRGHAVIGPKGSGKSLGLELACKFFNDMEHAKRSRDNVYRVSRILRVRAPDNTNYRDTAVIVAKALSKTYIDRIKGRKKTNHEILGDVVQLCLNQKRKLIVVDEGENLSADALKLLRDLITDSEAADAANISDDGLTTGTAGVGILIAGDEELERILLGTGEASHRWATTYHVELLTLSDVVAVYGVWFPGFAEHITAVGPDAWARYLDTTLCCGSPGIFRVLDNHARAYVQNMFNSDRRHTDKATLPFSRGLFEKAADEVTWALGHSAGPRTSKRSGRSKKRKGGSS